MFLFISSVTENEDDRDFMWQLYDEYRPLMFSVARRYLANQSDQEDIVHDSIEKLIKKISLLRGMECCILVGYIVSTIRNTSINYLKRQGMVSTFSIDAAEDYFELESLAPTLPTLDELISLREQKKKLSSALGELPEELRLLLTGKYIYGYSDAELAEQLDCKPSSVRMKLTRARRAAYDLIQKQERDDDHDQT